MDEAVHDVLELVRVHLAVGGLDQHLGHERCEEGLYLLRLSTRLCRKNTWPSRSHLPPDGLGDQVSGSNSSTTVSIGMAVVRRRGQHRHVADLEEGHVQGPRDRRGGQRQAVDVRLELLEPSPCP